MIQCFVKKEYEAPFGLTQMPRLFSVSRTDEKASAHPRVMHAHDDLVEIVLVRGGESRYFVGGTPYEARRGDLFIFNSRVVHDEPSGPDRPVATSSLALGGLDVPGLRENTLIAEDSCPVCRLTEPQTVRLEHLYDVLYNELTEGNDDGAQVVLTGLDYEPGKVGSGCLSADGGTISLHERIAQYYPGTGDLFAAVVLGALLNGRALADACALAGEFVKDCIAYTAAQHTDPMHGVQFEKLLPRLFSCHENRTEV